MSVPDAVHPEQGAEESAPVPGHRRPCGRYGRARVRPVSRLLPILRVVATLLLPGMFAVSAGLPMVTAAAPLGGWLGVPTAGSSSGAGAPVAPPLGCVATPRLSPVIAVVPRHSDVLAPIVEPFARAMRQARHGRVWIVGYCSSTTRSRVASGHARPRHLYDGPIGVRVRLARMVAAQLHP